MVGVIEMTALPTEVMDVTEEEVANAITKWVTIQTVVRVRRLSRTMIAGARTRLQKKAEQVCTRQ